MVFLGLHFLSFLALVFSVAKFREFAGQISIVLIVFVIILASFNYNVGLDYFAYQEIFDSVYPLFSAAEFEQIITGYVHVHGEYGFLLMNSFLKYFFDSHNSVYFASSSIVLFFLFLVFNRFSRNISLSIFIYISLYLINFHFVQIRLGLAASLVLFSFLFLLPKGWVYFFVGVLVAALFHKLALFAIPLSFLVAFNVKFVLCALFILAPIFSFLNPVNLFLDLVLGVDTYAIQQLEGYASKEKYQGNAFPWVSFFARLMVFGFLVRGYFASQRKDYFTESLIIFVSLSFFFWVAVWDLSILASRLNSIFFLGFCVLVPRVLSCVHNKSYRITLLSFVSLYGFLSFYKMIFDPAFNFFYYQSIVM